MRVQINENGRPRAAVLSLPDDLSLYGLFEAARIVLESRDTKHRFTGPGFPHGFGNMQKERSHPAMEVLKTGEDLCLQLGSRTFRILPASGPQPPYEADAKAIQSLEGNRQDPDALEAALKALLTAQRAASEKQDDGNPVEHFSPGSVILHSLPDGLLDPKPDLLDLRDRLFRHMDFFSTYTWRQSRDPLPLPEALNRQISLLEKTKRWKSTVQVSLSTDHLSHFIFHLNNDLLAGLCCALSRDISQIRPILQETQTQKDLARAFYTCMKENPHYWFYVLDRNDLETLRRLFDGIGREGISMSDLPGDLIHLVRVGLASLTFPPGIRDRVEVALPENIGTLLRILDGLDSDAVYALLEEADRTMRCWLEVYGVLSEDVLFSLGGPGLDEFTEKEEQIRYMRLHGMTLPDISPMIVALKPRSPFHCTVFSIHFPTSDIYLALPHLVKEKYKVFSGKDREKILRGEAQTLSPQFSRLRRFMILLRNLKGEKTVSDQFFNETVDQVYYWISSGIPAILTLLLALRLYDPCDLVPMLMLYFLILDCMMYMPCAVLCGASWNDQASKELMSLSTPNQYSEEDLPSLPMPVHPEKEQHAFFGALDARGPRQVFQVIREKAAQADMDYLEGEFAFYRLYALIAFEKEEQVNAQVAVLRSLAPKADPLIDWFIPELRQRMEELPPDRKKAYRERALHAKL